MINDLCVEKVDDFGGAHSQVQLNRIHSIHWNCEQQVATPETRYIYQQFVTKFHRDRIYYSYPQIRDPESQQGREWVYYRFDNREHQR